LGDPFRGCAVGKQHTTPTPKHLVPDTAGCVHLFWGPYLKLGLLHSLVNPVKKLFSQSPANSLLIILEGFSSRNISGMNGKKLHLPRIQDVIFNGATELNKAYLIKS
jgi:hypothetical protein